MHALHTPPDRSWWQRNWKWCVPVLVTMLLGLCLGAVAALVMGLMGVMKSSTPYRDAVQAAQHDPQVAAALGEPVEPGWFFSGNISTTNDRGEAALQIPLRGPHGKADLVVEGTKTGGQWRYSTLQVQPDDGQPPIDLQPALSTP